MVARITQISRTENARRHRQALTNEFSTPPPPLKLRNEPDHYYHASKRDPRVSLPRLKFLERD